MTVSETGTQYLAILSQTLKYETVFELSRSLQGCRVPFLHRVTRYCVFIPMSNQEPVPRNIEQLVTVIQVGTALPSSLRVHGYPCVSHVYPLYSRIDPAGCSICYQWPGANGEQERTKATGGVSVPRGLATHVTL